MNQVVNFLSLLTCDEDTPGGVKPMLRVCAEFERIAKVVLDKSEKESHSRRKRKNNKDTEEHLPVPILEKRPQPRTPEPTNASTPANILTPSFSGDLNSTSFNPSLNSFPSPTSNNENFPPVPDYLPGPGDFPNMMTSVNGGLSDFSDMSQFGNGGMSSPLNMGSFQQPFVPQDLWQMPMTLEWDWADMAGNGPLPNVDGNGDLFTNGVNGAVG